MNKNAIRLVALLVVHCLLVDPATASALSPSASGGVSISQDLPRFSEEAFSARAAFQLAPPRLVMARIVALAVGVGALISITAHSTPADTLAYQAGAYGATGIVASGTTVVGSGTPAGHLGIIVLGALGIIWGFKHLGRILNAVLIDPRNYFKDGVIGTFFHHLKNLGHIHSTLAFIAACGWVLELSIVSLVHPGNPTGVLKMLSQFTPMGDVRFAAAAVVAALVMLYFDKKYNPSENGHPMAGTSAAGSIGEPLATGRLEDSSSALSLSGTYVRGIPPLRRVQAESIEYGHPTEWIVRSTVADLHLLREYNRAVLQNRLADLPRDENGLLDVERRWIQVHVAPDDLREFLFHTFRPTSFAHAHIPEGLMGQARESVKQSLEQASLYMHTMVMKSVRGAIAKTAWLVPLFVFFTYVSAADILPSWVPVFRVPDLNLPHPFQWVVLLLIPLSMLVSICVVWKAARQTHRVVHKAYNVLIFSPALTLPGGSQRYAFKNNGLKRESKRIRALREFLKEKKDKNLLGFVLYKRSTDGETGIALLIRNGEHPVLMSRPIPNESVLRELPKRFAWIKDVSMLPMAQRSIHGDDYVPLDYLIDTHFSPRGIVAGQSYIREWTVIARNSTSEDRLTTFISERIQSRMQNEAQTPATGRLEDSNSALSLSGTYVRGIPPLRRVQAESIEYGHPTEWIVRSTVADRDLLREYSRAVLQNRLADLPRDENGLLDVERRWIQVHVAPDDLREFLFHTFRPTSFAHAHIPEYLMGQARESVKQSLEQASLYMHSMVMKSVRGAIAKTAWLVPLFVFFAYVSAADILPSWVPVFRVPDLNLPHPIQWVVLLLIPLSMLVSICVVWKAARQTHREAHKAYNVSTFSRALTLPGGPPAAGPSRSDEDRQPSGGRTINGIATGGLVGRPLAALYHWLIRKFHLSHYEIRTVYAPIIETIVFQGLFIGLPMLLGYFHNGLRGIVHWGALGVVFSPLIYGSQLTHPLIYRRSTYAEKPATREESQTLIGRGLLVSLRFYVHALLPIAVYWILSFYVIWRGLPVGSFNMPHTLLIIYLFVAALEGLIAAALFHRKTNKSSDLQGVATGGRSGQNGPTEWKPGTDLAPANWIRLLKHLEVHGGNFDSESVSMAINSTAARSSLGRHNGSLILKNIYYLLTGSSETSVLDPARTLVLVEFAQRVLMGLAMRPIGEPTHDTYSIMSLLRYNPTAKQVKKILTPEEIVRFIDRAKEILGISQSPAQSYRTAA